MATGPKRNRRVRRVARQRLLAVELFEPRFVLSGAPTALDQTVTVHGDAAAVLVPPGSQPCHNARNPSDVNGDGYVSPADVLIEMNYLQAAGPRPIGEHGCTAYFDVNDDGSITYADLSLILDDVLGPGNRPPASKDFTVTALFNVPHVFQLTDFAFSDLWNYPQNNFVAVEVLTVPEAGNLVDDGEIITGPKTIPIGDISAGKLLYLPPADGLGLSGVTFDFQVLDDGGPLVDGVIPVVNHATVQFNPRPGHNELQRFDVTGDGAVAPDDAVAIVNYLNAFGSGRAADPGPAGPFCDVNGDGFIAPNDVVEVINYINASKGSGEGESGGGQRNVAAGTGVDDVMTPLATDVTAQGKRKS